MALMKRLLVVATFLASSFGAAVAVGASPSSPAQQLMSKLSWRSIGPYIGGRGVAVAGVPSQRRLFYFGGVEGGRLEEHRLRSELGEHHATVRFPASPIPSAPWRLPPQTRRCIYVGTGEADIRGDFDTGDGVYKTTDAGKTWSYAGPARHAHDREDRHRSARTPNVVYAASMGHVFRSNPERGVFKTTDGGSTWSKILFVDDKTGGVDLVMDPRNPNVLYAAMWQAQRVPWKLTSGGPGSGLYKTADGGAHWTKISSNPGFATRRARQDRRLGRGEQSARRLRDRAGAQTAASSARTTAAPTWRRVNSEMKLRQRAFYYMAIFVDPTNPQVAYAPEVDGVYRTKDGGKTWTLIDMPHGDNHIVWINPRNPEGTARRQRRRRRPSPPTAAITWSADHNQPTGQFYHVALDDQFPFHVFGASQDEGAFEGPSAAVGPGIGPASGTHVALRREHVRRTRARRPRRDLRQRLLQFVRRASTASPATRRTSARGRATCPARPRPKRSTASAGRIRSSSRRPIRTSCSSRRKSSSRAWIAGRRGRSSAPISRATTRPPKAPTGGPIDNDQTGAETFPDISSLAVSPLDANILWAGSADGLVHVTTDHGAHWQARNAAAAAAVGADQLDRALAYRRRAPPISPPRATCGTITVPTSTRRPTTARTGPA